MIEITYYGVLKEQIGVAQERIEWGKGTTDDLLLYLQSRGVTWQEALASQRVFCVVVNGVICHESVALGSGDQVALLPPVTGG